MCDLELYLPHRESIPRRCTHDGCQVLLSSANETSKCWLHGGWIELISHRERIDAFKDLTEREAALA